MSDKVAETLRSETRDGMRIDWDVPIQMDDGLVLRADVFRPIAEGRYPVIMSHGPYGKLLHFEDGYVTAWRKMVEDFPEVLSNSSNRYQSWEVVDPEKWVPHGYAVVRVDSRGSGRSPGVMSLLDARETRDFALCIEWGGVQQWSNGKVGLNGISYYAINQWLVASLQPKHLAAICLWEGAADYYRDFIYHGGMYCTFSQNWYDMQLTTVQHGLGRRGRKSRFTGDLVSGPTTLTDEQLGANRRDMWRDLLEHRLDDDYHRERSADLSRVEVPMLSAGNWGGQGLHPRGNFEGFVNAASEQKWLEVHGIEHWTHFYTDYGIDLQRRFFDYFLKDEKNGWDRQPKVQLQVRHPGDKFVQRYEEAWPIPRTQWTKFHLEAAGHSLHTEAPTKSVNVTFQALGDGVTFLTEPMEQETEITGPIAARLQVSSSTTDADLFLVVRLFTPDMKEITFRGALDPHTPVAQGWLRASHRKLDPDKTLPYRPYHTHDEVQPLEPGKPYTLDVEIWPTCIVVPAGYRVGLTIRGRDYVFTGDSGARSSNLKNDLTGCGPFLHNDPRDRTMDRFDGETCINIGADQENYLLLPIIPAKGGQTP